MPDDLADFPNTWPDSQGLGKPNEVTPNFYFLEWRIHAKSLADKSGLERDGYEKISKF